MTDLPPDLLAPGGPGIARLLGASLGAAGCETSDSLPLTAWAQELSLPRAPRVCVVLVDGLGYENVRERSGHFPFLRRVQDSTRALVTVMPSTTASAISSIGTGSQPGATGMLGYTVRDPESGELVNLIRWDEEARPIREWQTVPTLAERLTRPERFALVGPSRFVGSGLNTAAFLGGRDVSTERLDQRVDAAVAELRGGRADVVYLYWGEVDHVGHVHGWTSWQWGEEASRTDAELARLARELPAGTLLVITADHGMIDVSTSIDAAVDPLLAPGVDLISGEPRAMHLFTADPDGVIGRWQERLGDGAWVLSHDAAVPLYRDLDPRFEASIGDAVVFMRGRGVVVDSRTQSPGSMALVGVHGSLTAPEMLVPLTLVEC